MAKDSVGNASIQQDIVVPVARAIPDVLRRPLPQVNRSGQRCDRVAVYQQPRARCAISWRTQRELRLKFESCYLTAIQSVRLHTVGCLDHRDDALG